MNLVEPGGSAPIHVYPVNKGHNTESPQCWCGPEMLKLCPECADEKRWLGSPPDCWRCGGRGIVPVNAPGEVQIVSHRDVES